MTDASLLLTVLVLTGSGGTVAGALVGFWLGGQSIDGTIHGAAIGYAAQAVIELLIGLTKEDDGPRMVVSEPPPQPRAW